jgi:hypothetical protein
MKARCLSSLLLLSPVANEAFQGILPGQSRAVMKQTGTAIFLSPSDAGEATVEDDDDDEEEENVEPGQMRVSEIKSELDMRGISYADCFDKDSLAERLREARATGRANPEIIDKFNKAKLEQTFREEKLEIKEEDLQSMTANDGTLPGGLSPETFQKMVGNPELMALLQSTKMQEAMKVIMTSGPKELEEAMKADPELQETLGKLNKVMADMGLAESNSSS